MVEGSVLGCDGGGLVVMGVGEAGVMAEVTGTLEVGGGLEDAVVV